MALRKEGLGDQTNMRILNSGSEPEQDTTKPWFVASLYLCGLLGPYSKPTIRLFRWRPSFWQRTLPPPVPPFRRPVQSAMWDLGG